MKSNFRKLSMVSAYALAGITAALMCPTNASAATSICDAVTGNLVTNCGFEGGVYTSTVGGFTNSNVPNGWTANTGFDQENGFNHTDTGSGANSGNAYLSIGNDEGQAVPVLSQTLSDTSGVTYTVSFYALYGGFGEGDPNAFLSLIAGSSVESLNSLTPNSWQLYSFQFVGTGADTLSISALTNPSEFFVDDISVTGNAVTATPLPAALPLFAGGLGMIGMFSRRKKRKAA